MRRFALMWLALAMSTSPAAADTIALNGFNNNTAATGGDAAERCSP